MSEVEKVFKTNDVETNDVETNDVETNDDETNDDETNDVETNDVETNDDETNDVDDNTHNDKESIDQLKDYIKSGIEKLNLALSILEKGDIKSVGSLNSLNRRVKCFGRNCDFMIPLKGTNIPKFCFKCSNGTKIKCNCGFIFYVSNQQKELYKQRDWPIPKICKVCKIKQNN